VDAANDWLHLGPLRASAESDGFAWPLAADWVAGTKRPIKRVILAELSIWHSPSFRTIVVW